MVGSHASHIFNKEAYWFMAIQLVLNDDEKS